jgi:hypothetical protein
LRAPGELRDLVERLSRSDSCYARSGAWTKNPKIEESGSTRNRD